jgi:histidine ammonia-lyase
VTEETVVLDGKSLTIEAVEAVARSGARAALDTDLIDELQEAASRHRAASAREKSIHPEIGLPEKGSQSRALNLSDLDSAPDLSQRLAFDQVRAGMLVQANHLASTSSGVRPKTLTTLLAMLEHNITPHIPSLGPSGAWSAAYPLHRTTAVLSVPARSISIVPGAEAWFEGELLRGEDAMRSAGLEPVLLSPEEARSLSSGTAFCTAGLALALLDAQRLFEASLIAAAMSLEALLGVSAAFDERLHRARMHPGQVRVAQRMRELTTGSSLIDRGDHVQDAYSLRCIPQVLGPIQEWMQFAVGVVEGELNPSADSTRDLRDELEPQPTRTETPIALTADTLKTAFTTCGAIAERRIFRLISDHTNRGLPAMLVADPEAAGFQSGLMMLQYTAASLVHENQSLAVPALVEPYPPAGTEPGASNAMAAVHQLNEILDNVTHIVAIEMITAIQALDLRLRETPHLALGKGVQIAKRQIRASVPQVHRDRPLSDDVHQVAELLASGRLLSAVADGLQNESLQD